MHFHSSNCKFTFKILLVGDQEVCHFLLPFSFLFQLHSCYKEPFLELPTFFALWKRQYLSQLAQARDGLDQYGVKLFQL